MLIMPSDVLRLCPVSDADLAAMRTDGAWAELQVAEQVEAIMAGVRGRGLTTFVGFFKPKVSISNELSSCLSPGGARGQAA